MISNRNQPNEPTIMMDPKNPSTILAACNLNNYYISKDTGRTWTEHILSSPYGVWGDPVLAVDTSSNFYFFHLSNPPTGNWIDRIVCQKSGDDGSTWSPGSFTGLNGTKAQDKQWFAIDRTNNNIYLTWTQFDDYGSTNPQDSSIILFSKSLDEGITWSAPKRINTIAGDCIDSDNTVEGAVPAVGPNGEIYVAWAGPLGILFNRSKDQGDTWLGKEIKVDPMPTGWDYAVPGIYRANGLPFTMCDLSNGPNRGDIYINWSDQRNGPNDTDVWLSKSSDGGDTWTSPVRVNEDAGHKHQFFTSMSIDQTTGYLYFVFYDRRNYIGSATDVYLAISTDGGNTFINRKISEVPFIPNGNIFFGDYTNITAHNNIVRPIWTRLHENELSVWTNLTEITDIISSTADVLQTDESQFLVYPNPMSDAGFVSFKLRKSTIVSLNIVDSNSKIVTRIIDNERRDYGKYVEKIPLSSLGLPFGTYFIRLELDDEMKINRMVKL